MKGQAWWVQWTGAKYGNPAAGLQFQHTNNIKEKKIKLRLHQFHLLQAELSKILYSTVYSVMLNIMMVLSFYAKI